MKQRKPTMTKLSDSNPFFDLTRRGGDGVKIQNGIHTHTNTATNIIGGSNEIDDLPHDDTLNYALLIALYTLQGIPMGLSASIPFLIQQKVKVMAEAIASSSVLNNAASTVAESTISANASASITKMAYNAQAIFALCSWPFSLKLLWAPIVDALYFKGFGRRKSWLVPVQTIASLIMILGSDYVENQLGLGANPNLEMQQFDVKGVTAFFFVLYFLMATQDIAVDGWALTMLSKQNRGRGPVCNSIGQNLGYFLAFVGFLALNDAESSEKLWRPLLGLKSNPDQGLVSLGSFIKFMGFVMLVITTIVALFKKEMNSHGYNQFSDNGDNDDDAELDASQIGLAETYHRLWAVCKLPSVRLLFLVLLTYRFPTALSDKVKFLKAVEFGMSKQTTALLAPTIILPLGITVPIIAAKIWKNHPLKQFMAAYKLRVTLVPFLDVCMLLAIRAFNHNTDFNSRLIFWSLVISSTAMFSIVDSMQFNAQMTFFAHRVDPTIGGSYMTLLNTAANLGGTWPASIVMFLVGQLSVPPSCETGSNGEMVCTGGREAYFPMQMIFSILGCLWVYFMGKKVMYLSALPDDAWRTHIDEEDKDDEKGK
jgi:MFS transporter, PAT family, solute carrier family 33 (acetyl-CoA transportor), member 1